MSSHDTESNSAAVEAGQITAAPPTVRVSLRELAEATRWALAAAGCSAGDADVAGRIVQLGEAHRGCGLDAVNNELLNHRFSSDPIHRISGRVDIIADDRGRGLLTLAPLAAALAGSRGREGSVVVLVEASWHPVLGAILVDALRQACPGVAALAAWPLIDGDRRSGVSEGVLVTAGSEVAGPLDPAIVESQLADLETMVWPRGGVAISPATPLLGHISQGATSCSLVDGVQVDAAAWGRLQKAAKAFLVEDA